VPSGDATGVTARIPSVEVTGTATSVDERGVVGVVWRVEGTTVGAELVAWVACEEAVAVADWATPCGEQPANGTKINMSDRSVSIPAIPRSPFRPHL
jgi:hypothetical protein